MKLTLRQFDQPDGCHGTVFDTVSRDMRPRGAFTLTELLVAMGIFVILATLTVGAFRANSQDRVGNAAAIVKNALEGARSRAINSGEVRGLRLLLDSNNNHIATSIVYVGAPGYLEGTVNIGNVGTTTTLTDTASEWSNLASRNLIQNGSRIELPRGSGRWYTVTGAGGNTLTMNGFYEPSRWDGSNFVAVDSTAVPYKLELAPTILEGADPVPLDPQVCIDLDGCIIPWRVAPPAAAPPAPQPGEYSTPMDILFNPNGTITGDLATEGIVHILFSYTSDVILAEALGSRPTTTASPSIPTDPEKDRKVVSIFAATGGVVVSNVNAVDTDGVPFNAGTVSRATAYKFAISGQEAK